MKGASQTYKCSYMINTIITVKQTDIWCLTWWQSLQIVGVVRVVRFTSAGQVAGSPFVLKLNKYWYIKTTSEQEWNSLLWKEAEDKKSTDKKEKERTYPTQRSFLLWPIKLNECRCVLQSVMSQLMLQWCPGISDSSVIIKTTQLIGTSLGAIDSYTEFCPWIQMTMVWGVLSSGLSVHLQSMQNVLLLIITKGFPYECTFGYNRSLSAVLIESGNERSRAQKDKTEYRNFFE